MLWHIHLAAIEAYIYIYIYRPTSCTAWYIGIFAVASLATFAKLTTLVLQLAALAALC